MRGFPRPPAPAAFVLLFALGGCGGAEPEPRVIRLGFITPISGGFFSVGDATVDGARLAVDEINRAGGVRVGDTRREIELLVEDNESRSELAVSKALRLVGEGVVALLGVPVSDTAIAVAKVARSHRVPLVSVQSTHPETTRDNPWAFRVASTDELQARALAEFAFDDLGARRAALLYDGAATYSAGFNQVFREAFLARGGAVELFENYTAGQPRPEVLLDRVVGADVLVLAMYSRSLRSLLPEIHRVGLEVTLLGSETWSAVDSEYLAHVDEAYYAGVWHLGVSRPASRRFVATYEEAGGAPPVASAALAYDAVRMVVAAIESRGAADAEAIRLGLEALRDFDGATGLVRSMAGGDPVRGAVILRVTPDGSAELHREIGPT